MASSARKSQLIHEAADLFARRGFAAVTVQDIAERAGLTAGAMYRHVESKEALLDDVLIEATRTFRAALSPAAEASPRSLIERAVRCALDEPGLLGAYVHQRPRVEEAPPELADGEAELARLWRSLMTALHPNLGDREAATRGHAVGAVVAAIADTAPRLSTRRLTAAIADGIEAVVTARLRPGRDASVPAAPAWAPTVGRRQQIINAAIELFSERSYDRVALADVGLRAGVAAPTMYEYFETKLDILFAAYDLGGALLTTLRLKALDGATDADDALAKMAAGFTDLCFGNKALITVNSRAWFWIPAADQPRWAQYREEVDELWSNVLREANPGLTSSDARFITNCTSWLILHVARSTDDDSARRGHVTTLALEFMRTAARAAAPVGASPGRARR